MRGNTRKGSATVGALAVFIAGLVALGLLAYVSPQFFQSLIIGQKELAREAERSSELLRVYLYTPDDNVNSPPIVTFVNLWHEDTVITDYYVVARNGSVILAATMARPLTVSAGSSVTMRLSDLGLNYPSFISLTANIRSIYFRTSEGNAFGSTFGPPPRDMARLVFFETSRNHLVFVFGTTTYRYSVSITGRLPELNHSIVQTNLILLDPQTGRVSDFHHGYKVEAYPTGVYMRVPFWPTWKEGYCAPYGGTIEVVEIWPAALYRGRSSGSVRWVPPIDSSYWGISGIPFTKQYPITVNEQDIHRGEAWAVPTSTRTVPSPTTYYTTIYRDVVRLDTFVTTITRVFTYYDELRHWPYTIARETVTYRYTPTFYHAVHVFGMPAGVNVIHLVGYASPFTLIKIGAPLVLLNYYYTHCESGGDIPDGGGGGGGAGGDNSVVKVCEVTGTPFPVTEAGSSGGGPATEAGSSGGGASSGQSGGGTSYQFYRQKIEMRQLSSCRILPK